MSDIPESRRLGRQLAYSPDGNRLAATAIAPNDQPTVVVFELSTNESRRIPVFQSTEAVCFLDDNRTLLVAPWNGRVEVWDTQSIRKLKSRMGHTFAITSLAINQRQSNLLTSGHDRTVKIWDLAELRKTHDVASPGAMHCFAYSDDGRLLASEGADGVVQLWDSASGSLVREIATSAQAPLRMTFSPNGDRFAIASSSGRLSVHDVSGRQPAATFPNFSGTPLAIKYSDDGQQLIVYSTERRYRYGVARRNLLASRVHPFELIPDFEIEPPPGIPQFRHVSGSLYKHIEVSRDGRWIARYWGSSVTVWDMDSGQQLYQDDASHSEVLHCLAFSHDGELLASSGQDNLIQLRETRTGQIVATLHGHLIATGLSFAPDRLTLASGHIDGHVTLWDLRTRREILRLQGPRLNALSVLIAPDGRSLAAAGWDPTVWIWQADPPDNQPLRIPGTIRSLSD